MTFSVRLYEIGDGWGFFFWGGGGGGEVVQRHDCHFCDEMQESVVKDCSLYDTAFQEIREVEGSHIRFSRFIYLISNLGLKCGWSGCNTRTRVFVLPPGTSKVKLFPMLFRSRCIFFSLLLHLNEPLFPCLEEVAKWLWKVSHFGSLSELIVSGFNVCYNHTTQV